MSDLPSHPDVGDTRTGPDRGLGFSGQRWRRLAGIAALVGLAVLFLVLHLTGVLGPGAHK